MATRLRADARRNQQQILAAARDVVLERGPNAPLDEIARRAGVGIGTLYRRFPDRENLLKAVVLEALGTTAAAARDAIAEEADPFDALARYLREALELRVSAVIPLVLDVLDLEDPELRPARTESSELIEQIIRDAQAAGSLPRDVTFGDIAMMLVRIARPLPGPLNPELNHEIARRHLELFIRGLRALPDSPDRAPELSGPELGLAELRELTGGG